MILTMTSFDYITSWLFLGYNKVRITNFLNEQKVISTLACVFSVVVELGS